MSQSIEDLKELARVSGCMAKMAKGARYDVPEKYYLGVVEAIEVLIELKSGESVLIPVHQKHAELMQLLSSNYLAAK